MKRKLTGLDVMGYVDVISQIHEDKDIVIMQLANTIAMYYNMIEDLKHEAKKANDAANKMLQTMMSKIKEANEKNPEIEIHYAEAPEDFEKVLGMLLNFRIEEGINNTDNVEGQD